MFPSLVNFCTINWIEPWPKSALQSVSRKKLEGVDASQIQALSDVSVAAHITVVQTAATFLEVLGRQVYITPKQFLDVIEQYHKIAESRTEELNTDIHRYSQGVHTLNQTNLAVERMQKELEAKQPILQARKEEASMLTAKVQRDTTKANQVRELAENEEQQITQQKSEIEKVQKEAQRAINKTLPALHEAVRALDTINKVDLAEIKTFTSPPYLVRFTLEIVCALLAERSDWDNIKRIVGANNFLDRLKNFEKDSISRKALKLVRQKIQSNPDYNPETVAVKNRASASFCKWTLALDRYARVQEDLAPKREHLANMNKFLLEAKSSLKDTQERLQDAFQNVETLQKQLEEAQNESNRLDREVAITELKVQRAMRLTAALNEENERWTQAIHDIELKLSCIPGDCYLTSSCLIYYGPFTEQYRHTMHSAWLASCQSFTLPFSPKHSLQSQTISSIQVHEWSLQNLPKDDSSVDNAILTTRAKNIPLIIDPQEQAKRWIKRFENIHGLAILHMQSYNWEQNVEACVKKERPVLLEDVGLDLPSNLFTMISGYEASNFRMYITTKIENPLFLPEIQTTVTLINFSVTFLGLEEQLLSQVVSHELPKIEKDLLQLQASLASDNHALSNVQDQILKSIGEQSNRILDNESVIDQLAQSKQISLEIEDRIEQTKLKKSENEVARDQYRPVARRGAVLYMSIGNLGALNFMYKTSLETFQNLYNQVIQTTPAASDIEQRVSLLMQRIMEEIYTNTCQGLFNAHKIVFSFMLALQLSLSSEIMTTEECSYLLGETKEDPVVGANQFPESIGIDRWRSLLQLLSVSKQLRSLNLEVTIARDSDRWQQWIKNPLQPPPTGREISLVSHMLLVNALAPQSFTVMIPVVIQDILGEYYVTPKSVSILEVFQQVSGQAPLLIILAQGSDPVNDIVNLAEVSHATQHLTITALGQGQEKRAEALIQDGIINGQWVVLQNCHLFESWLPTLEKMVVGLADKQVSENFRLILTSKPCTFFPVEVLQKCVKMTSEYPSGIAQGLRIQLARFTDDMLDEPDHPYTWPRLLFGLCFFHAIVKERGKFGPIGWTFPYEFNSEDLATSITFLRQIVADNPNGIPWSAVKFMIGDIVYGGRVVDALDMRLLRHMITIYIGEEAAAPSHQYSMSGQYHAPKGMSLAKWRTYVTTLPAPDPTEVFGLTDTALSQKLLKTTQTLLSDVAQTLRTQILSVRDASSEERLQGQKKIVGTLLDRLPNEIETDESIVLRVNQDTDPALVCLSVFLRREVEQFNRLLGLIQHHLQALQAAFNGFALITPELEQVALDLWMSKVPDVWIKHGYLTEKPLAAYMDNFLTRFSFINRAYNRPQGTVFWLSAFFFPYGFLTTLMQAQARKFEVPIDDLHLSYEVLPIFDANECPDGQEDTYYIHGLYMQCCEWDVEQDTIVDTKSDNLLTQCPILEVVVTETASDDTNLYAMPVYKTSKRAGVLNSFGYSTNYITTIAVPSNQPAGYWMLRGAAFLCQPE